MAADQDGGDALNSAHAHCSGSFFGGLSRIITSRLGLFVWYDNSVQVAGIAILRLCPPAATTAPTKATIKAQRVTNLGSTAGPRGIG